MSRSSVLAALALAASLALPAQATTLIRMGVGDLVERNETAVVARVLGVDSRWNDSQTFILSDVRVSVEQTLLGAGLNEGDEVTFTVMGGTVGDRSVVIVAGPELEPGNRYVLFLGREDLPGSSRTMTVRDLSQGIFDVAGTGSQARVVSQAVHHPLVPDAAGTTQPPGGAAGMTLTQLATEIRTAARARGRR